ncbi:MAG: hypothetical protein IKJ00_06450 [Clostridia bacterium]|nr:hypothetical protein [Clostridia bacterium]
MKKLTKQEQRKLRNKAKEEVERLERILNDEVTSKSLDDFKNKFNICESAYKIILRKHQIQKGKSNTTSLKINMTQVPHALRFAGYNFDDDLLTHLFGAKSQKGKTVKKLRDNITHGIDEKSVKEIINRKDELFGYMDSFINIIKTYDDSVA